MKKNNAVKTKSTTTTRKIETTTARVVDLPGDDVLRVRAGSAERDRTAERRGTQDSHGILRNSPGPGLAWHRANATR